jgi:hypothetical protein
MNSYSRKESHALKHLESEIEVHHAVEQRVLDLYPGILSESEIHSLQNLRGFPTDLIDSATGKPLHRSTIRIRWDDFYQKYEALGRAPAKQELLDFATHIDDLYGHLFDPQVR